jgi:SAM-dependent methyltransferase
MAENFDLFARFYDLDHGTFTEDLSFYLGFAQRTGSPVLDAGCGTGRVLLPLARAGYAVTGLDVSPAMLACARARLAAEPAALARATLVEADVRAFALDTRFALAFMALNTFLHLVTLEDQRAALRRLHAHLQSGGLLLLDLFNPLASQLAVSEGQLLHEWTRTDPATGRTVLKFMTHHSDFATHVVHATFLYDEVDAEGVVRRTVAPFRLRFIARPEIELLLAEAGFALEALYGTYDLGPYVHDSPRLLVVARRP